MRQPAKQAKSRAVSPLSAFPTRPAAPSTAVAIALCLAALASMAIGYMLLAAGIGAVAAAWLIYVRLRPAPESLTRSSPRLPMAVAMLAVVLTTIAMLPPNTQKPGADQVGTHILLLAGLLTSAAALFSPLIDRFLRRRPVVLWLVLIAGSAAFTWAVYGKLIEARWFPIDDHEIMSFLGPKGEVRLADIPAVLMTTEVGSPGGPQPRYRPSYYFFRILETSLWSDSAFAWHLSHLCLLAISLVLYWRFFMRWLGMLPAAMLILFMMTYFFWTDIWNRLGPAEAYCVVGVGMFLLAYLSIWRRIHNPLAACASPWSSIGLWLGLTFGAMLAMGAKESFLLMLLPMWVLAVAALLRRRAAITAAICTLIATTYGIFIAAAVSISIANRGGDVYHQEVSASSRLGLLWSGIQGALQPLAWWDCVLGVLLIALPMLLLFKGSRRRVFRRASLRAALAIAGLVGLYAFQVVFYKPGGSIVAAYPTQMRYDFPGVPAKVLLAVAAVVFVLAVLRKSGLAPWIVRSLRAGLAGGVLILTVHAGYGPIIARAEAYSQATQWWTASLERSIDIVKRDPTRAIVVVPHSVESDYEPVDSVQRFMRAKGVSNPMFLDLRAVRRNADDPQSRDLAKTLMRVAVEGGTISPSIDINRGFRPWSSLPANVRSFGIGLSGYVDASRYDNAGVLWPILPTEQAFSSPKTR